MDDELQELKKQRELIRQHLAWLDRRIDAKEGQHEAQSPPASPPEPQAKIPAEQLKPTATPTSDHVLHEALKAERSEHADRLGGMDDLTKAKVGCLGVFGLGVLIFLFILFGLPYLMD